MIKGKRHIPSKRTQGVVGFSLKVDGLPINKAVPILSLTIDREVNRIATAYITVRDGTPSEEDFEISSGAFFIPGKEVEILAGYETNENSIFKGIIVKHSICLERSGYSALELVIKDKAVTLALSRKNAIFEEMTDSEAIEEIAEAKGLLTEVESSKIFHAQLVQYQSSDWDFIICRAEANGFVVTTIDNKLVIQSPKVEEEPKLSLTYGANLFEFEQEIDIRNQHPSFVANSWDSINQEALQIEGEPIELKEAGNLSSSTLSDLLKSPSWEVYHSGNIGEQEVQQWADGINLKSKLSKIRGRVLCQGIGEIFPGDTIELRGMGDRFNGLAYVSGVRHELGDGNWKTHLSLGLSFDCFHKIAKDISAPPAGGLLPAVSGMHTGIVTQLKDDPDGEDRIQVRLPLIDPEGYGIWARLASLDAGNNRGAVFRPEIGDEVLVGFLNDDPRLPVILGMLHSSAKPNPIPAAADNNEKGFVSRSGTKLIFNDDDDSITIETQKGKKVQLNDGEGIVQLEDENGNKIIMDANGITFQSAKDIQFKATGNIKLEGVNVEAKASAAFKANGGASSELSASGSTKVKGSLVEIN